MTLSAIVVLSLFPVLIDECIDRPCQAHSFHGDRSVLSPSS